MESDLASTLRIPVSTYRLQFNHQFRFADAERIIPYLSDLGITDIYASPYFKAKEGSLHGYDIVDHNRLNPEIGSEAEYEGMIGALRGCGMGQILDIVPNHMCISSKENAWWMDVLENGPSSRYAEYFDIDWDPVKKELANKVLLPFLEDRYGAVLENGDLKLAFEEGVFFLRYREESFPLRPRTYPTVLQHGIDDLRARMGENASFLELMSITTALKNLPDYLETASEKVGERIREKEVARKRLWALYSGDEEIRNFIDEKVRVFNGTKGVPRSFDLLDGLIGEQVFRLSFWPVATEEINYRRFFDINSLGAIRVEKLPVFEETHKLVLKLINERKVTGLRVDHPDGLYNPSEYLHRLQRACFEQLMSGYAEEFVDGHDLPPGKTYLGSEVIKRYEEMRALDPQWKPFYILGEKILTKSERMPEEWPLFSTTGYVFLNSVNGIFVETSNARPLEKIYQGFIKTRMDYQEMVYRNKKLVMETAMASEINTLGHYLNRISEKSRHTRDFTLNSLTKAITDVIALFPVYRTYINGPAVAERDRQQIELAVARAKRKNPAINISIFDFLHDVLLLRLPDNSSDDDRRECLDFVMRFQQTTGPVMAKGLEDTTFYVYNRLISLNEVGGAPERFGTPLETFHGQNIERSKFWPQALITTSTHDSKRGEDARARINVLSEVPDLWRTHLSAWAKFNRNKKMTVDGHAVPERNDEYLLYQTLLGAWPLIEPDEDGYNVFTERIKEYMVKAIREAKVRTSWINIEALYEKATISFIDSVLRKGPGNLFLADFADFQKNISNWGMYNSLSQALLKIASPGVADFYQGTELWDFSLVDPDNRRPIDYALRMRALEEMKREETMKRREEFARLLTMNRTDGRIKIYLIYKALTYRKSKTELFESGEYIPLETFGAHADSACAFARRLGDSVLLCAVPRFLTRLIGNVEELPLGEKVWEDSVIAIPGDRPGLQYWNIFTGGRVAGRDHGGVPGLQLGEVFRDFPVALLEREGDR